MHPPPSPAQPNFTLMTECSPESRRYYSVYSVVRTVGGDLRRGEHIPKMQNDIGHKSALRMLRQPRSEEGGGAALGSAQLP
jgi:hypothetical protein